jgi:hypothetical protein
MFSHHCEPPWAQKQTAIEKSGGMEARRKKVRRNESGQLDEPIRTVAGAAKRIDGVPESASLHWLA